MSKKIKQTFYFLFATYFRFWAKVRLKQWQPYIIVVTASSGKTTLLHLLESQIGSLARYSHLANSSYGIPFHILGLQRKTFSFLEWVWLFWQAPVALLSPLPKEKIYIVEADCDRPGEGSFLATLLCPDVTLWLNVSQTHTQNFDGLVAQKQFPSIEKAISYEFGHFIAHTKEVVYLNGDSQLLLDERSRTAAKVEVLCQQDWLKKYQVSQDKTTFLIAGKEHEFDSILLPRETWLSLVMCELVCQKLKRDYDYRYKKFSLPPGRSSLFKGTRLTTLFDSSYNSNYESVRSVLELFKELQVEKKWLVLGDMVELGEEEEQEHEKIALLLQNFKFEQLILVGPRLSKYTLPLLPTTKKITSFLQPKDALDYVQNNLNGGEWILFKGSRFLEGIIESLLLDKRDAIKLCRRESVWQKRRQQWGL